MNEATWISLAALILSIIMFFIGRFAAKKSEGEKNGSIASDIGYIKAGIDDLKSEIKSIKTELAEYAVRLARAEESIKQAHKRLDELVKKE